MTFSVSLSPENPSVKKNKYIEFTATITGTPVGDVTYAWYVDDELVEGELPTISLISPATGTFTIKVEATDSDEYQVTEEDSTTLTVKFVFGRKGRLYGRQMNMNLANKKYRQTDKGRRTMKNTKLKFLYGITLKTFNEWRALQDNKCWLCDKEFTDKCLPYVDHDHNADKVRGLLCNSCNILLGWFENHREIIGEYLND